MNNKNLFIFGSTGRFQIFFGLSFIRYSEETLYKNLIGDGAVISKITNGININTGNFSNIMIIYPLQMSGLSYTLK